MKGIEDLSDKERKVVEWRIKVISFFRKYGKEATKDAFGVARSTVYLWMKRLKEGNYGARALVPLSRAPKTKRKRDWHPMINI